jgi:hypothetical protein
LLRDIVELDDTDLGGDQHKPISPHRARRSVVTAARAIRTMVLVTTGPLMLARNTRLTIAALEKELAVNATISSSRAADLLRS